MWPSTVRKGDLRIEYFRSTGAGGQNVNKVSSACRITHLVTGLACESREHRDQHQNKRTAFLKLAKLLVPIMRGLVVGDVVTHVDPATMARVRTYDETSRRVTDERVPGRQWRTDKRDLVSMEDLEEIMALVRGATS